MKNQTKSKSVQKTKAQKEAEQKNKELITILNNKMFKGYRQIKQLHSPRFCVASFMHNVPENYFPQEENYNIYYKEKYLSPLYKNNNQNGFDSLKITKLKPTTEIEPSVPIFSTITPNFKPKEMPKPNKTESKFTMFKASSMDNRVKNSVSGKSNTNKTNSDSRAISNIKSKFPISNTNNQVNSSNNNINISGCGPVSSTNQNQIKETTENQNENLEGYSDMQKLNINNINIKNKLNSSNVCITTNKSINDNNSNSNGNNNLNSNNNINSNSSNDGLNTYEYEFDFIPPNESNKMNKLFLNEMEKNLYSNIPLVVLLKKRDPFNYVNDMFKDCFSERNTQKRDCIKNYTSKKIKQREEIEKIEKLKEFETQSEFLFYISHKNNFMVNNKDTSISNFNSNKGLITNKTMSNLINQNHIGNPFLTEKIILDKEPALKLNIVNPNSSLTNNFSSNVNTNYNKSTNKRITSPSLKSEVNNNVLKRNCSSDTGQRLINNFDYESPLLSNNSNNSIGKYRTFDSSSIGDNVDYCNLLKAINYNNKNIAMSHFFKSEIEMDKMKNNNDLIKEIEKERKKKYDYIRDAMFPNKKNQDDEEGYIGKLLKGKSNPSRNCNYFLNYDYKNKIIPPFNFAISDRSNLIKIRDTINNFEEYRRRIKGNDKYLLRVLEKNFDRGELDDILGHDNEKMNSSIDIMGKKNKGKASQINHEIGNGGLSRNKSQDFIFNFKSN